MIQIGLVIFRELLEIALLLVLIYSTNSNRVKNFNYYLLIGSLLGISGSILLAFATPYLDGFFGGLGQEIFNSAVIFLTAGMIAFTVIYMRNYSQKIRSEVSHVGDQTSKGFLMHVSFADLNVKK